VTDVAGDLGRMLARVDELDEEHVRAELEFRFPSREAVELGLEVWRDERRARSPRDLPARRDLE